MLLKVDRLVCTKCKQEKPDTEFYNNKTMPRGKTYWCKVCTNHQNNVVQKETKAKWAARTHQNRRRERPQEHLHRMAKSRAKKRGLEFSIEPSDIHIPEYCPYLGVRLSIDTLDTSPSLDRIDSSKGYIKGNIQVISTRANKLKSDATEEQLLAFARGILEVHSKEGS